MHTMDRIERRLPTVKGTVLQQDVRRHIMAYNRVLGNVCRVVPKSDSEQIAPQQIQQ
jgi:hypothetical protein